MRAAVVGGAGYMAGKSLTKKKQHEAEQDQAIEQGQQQQPAPAPAPAPAAAAPSDLSPEALDQVKQLANLHTAGALTDEEFAAAKSKLLGL